MFACKWPRDTKTPHNVRFSNTDLRNVNRSDGRFGFDLSQRPFLIVAIALVFRMKSQSNRFRVQNNSDQKTKLKSDQMGDYIAERLEKVIRRRQKNQPWIPRP
jgi:hypothetical protein